LRAFSSTAHDVVTDVVQFSILNRSHSAILVIDAIQSRKKVGRNRHFAESVKLYQSNYHGIALRCPRKTLQCSTLFSFLRKLARRQRSNRSQSRGESDYEAASHPDQQYQTVTAYDDNGVEINMVRFDHSLLVLPETPPVAWPVRSFERLDPEHFAHIASTDPDVVILGTGKRQRFVHPKLTSTLTARRTASSAWTIRQLAVLTTF